MSYCQPEDVRAYVSIFQNKYDKLETEEQKTAYDEYIQEFIDRAEAYIDKNTGTKFSITEEERTFYRTDDNFFNTPDFVEIIRVDDLDGNEITDYKAYPPQFNVKNMIETPSHADDIVVNAKWGTVDPDGSGGWQTPSDIVQATLMITARLMKRGDFIFGTQGDVRNQVTVNTAIPADNDVMMILEPYKTWL
jgi:hypothetical protein